MKATIIVAAVLCVVVGGIAGWALRGAAAKPAAPVVLNLTPKDWDLMNRLAFISGNKVTVVEYDSNSKEIEISASRQIK